MAMARCSWARRAGAGAADPPDLLFSRRMTGRWCARRRTIHHGDKIVDRPIKQTRCRCADRQGRLPPLHAEEIHEQPAVVGDTLRALVNPLAGGSSCRRFPSTSASAAAAHRGGLRHRLSRRLVGNTGSSRSPGCRSISTSLGVFATASRARSRRRHLVISQSVRDARYPGGAALCPRQGRDPRHPERAGSTMAPNRTGLLPTLAGPEIGSPRPKASLPSWWCACLAIAAARARGVLDAAGEAALPSAARAAGTAAELLAG